MTRDEAILLLNQIKDYDINYDITQDVEARIEAIDMAIEALSRPTDGDLISRADAIEAVAKQWLFEASVESPYVNDDDIVEYRQLAEELLADIPSARPTGEWIPVTNGRGGHECDQCHDYAPSYQTGEEHLTNFCPNCGADMRGEKE